MTETLPEPPEIDPAGLAGTNFSRTRRGFEPTEVHAALGRAADALRAWKLRDAHFAARLADLEDKLADAQRLDESRLTEVLGEETARIVAAARDAAHEIRSHAERDAETLRRETAEEAHGAAEAMKGEAAALRDEAARVRDDAVAEATRVRTEAESEAEELESRARTRHDELIAEAEGVLALRTAAAEEVAAGITEAASAELDSARADAARLREEVAVESAAILESAREEGRAMVAEAKAVRERILRDLVERRATARRQIEGARAGRDRIVEVLRSTIAEVSSTIEGLGQVEDEAGSAAAEAAASILVETEAEVAELLVELGEDHPGSHDVVDRAAPGHDTTIVVPGIGGMDLERGAGGEGATTRAPAAVEPEDAASSSASAPDGAADHADDATSGEVEQPATDEPEPATSERSESGGEPGDEESGEDAPGATVHDLFARIRAEGLDDEQAGDDEADAEVADAPEVDPEAAHADGGDGAATDATPGDGDESESLAAAVGDEGIDLTGTPPATPTEPANVTVLPAGDAVGDTGGSDAAAEPVGGAVATLETPGQLLDLRDELLGPVEKSLSRVLRRLASDEQNELLDQLRRVKRGRPDVEALLAPHRAAGLDRFVDALQPDFARAADAGTEFWSRVSGSSADALFADDDVLRDRLTQRVTGFLDLHRAHLERTFGDAESEGLDVGEIADRVRAAYRDWRSGSLTDMAGDLATAGFAHGEARAAGPGTPWRWVVDNGGLPCADGEDNALAGAVPCEEPFPTGDLTPPAHPGCRCILAPAHQ